MMIFITEDDVFHMKEKPCIPLLKLQPLMYAVSNIGTQSTRASLFLSTVVCSTNNKNLDGNTILYMYEYGTCLYARTVYVIVPYEIKIIDSKGLELAKVVFRH